MYETLTLIIDIRGFNPNVESVHHFLQSSYPVALFSTETQICPSSDASHLQFLNCIIPTSLRLASMPLPLNFHMLTSPTETSSLFS